MSPSLTPLQELGEHVEGGSGAVAPKGAEVVGAGAAIVFLGARMTMGRGRGRAGASCLFLGARGRAGAPTLSLGARRGEGAASRVAASCRRAAGRAGSGRRRFGSMRASLRLSSRSRAPGPRRLALLAGEGAVAAAAVGAAGREEKEGARVPGAASWLLDGPLPLLGVW